MVLYRKYRSQTLDELIGQQTAKNSLLSAFKAQKLAHAYLFCGPRGTGKTSTARILAKMVNCEAKEGVIPCNRCDACLSITQGTNMDVIEMDAASNRGIEDIRNLKDTIKLAASSLKKKVYIIDEVHMLSGDAFNALLKTLEEPPSHVIFILATTEVQKIPATILSRVTRIDFKQATVTEAAELIKKAAALEEIEIDEEAVLTLAKKAGGSFRDAIKFLDQLSSFKKIDSKIVLEGLGSGDFSQTLNLLKSISLKKSSDVLDKLNEQIQTGINIKELTLSLLDSLRQILYIKNGLGERFVKAENSEEKYQQLCDIAASFETDQVVFIINNIQTSLEQARYTSIPILPLEIALVESCGVEKQVRSDKQSLRSDDLQQETESQKVRELVEQQVGEPEIADTQTLQDSDNPDSSDLQKIAERWNYILETVKAYNFSLEALMRSSKILECGESSVVVEVPYAFHQRILESAKSRDLLESVFSDILGRQIKVATALGKRPVQREEVSNIEVAADDEIVRIAAEIFNSETIN
ncbi:MAG: DNA polymerase III subunit gamma/tau [Candidatus Daviesbacteria bacterium]|nr:DNA polymerase III subunit gamma/tau [Candidatus Daviesbacteria bacterium]